MSNRLEELLAAHADDGLEPHEQAAVDRHLEAHPEHRGEVDDLREFLQQVRSLARAENATAESPDWDALAADIGRACDRVQKDRSPRWTARMRAHLQVWTERLVAPRTLVGIGAAVAVAVLLLVARYDSGPNSNPEPPMVTVLDSAIEPLDPTQLDDLLALLDPDVDDPDDDEWPDIIWPDELHGSATNVATPLSVDSVDQYLLPESDYDTWLDDLSESEIDALEVYLADVQTG